MTQAQAQRPHVKLPVLTERKGAWWAQSAITFVVFSTFIVYATWAAFQGDYYRFGSLLSPFYSPELFGDPASHTVQAYGMHAWFGAKPAWWPAFLAFSPAILILWAPGGFRFTCYYYRGAYYKAFWADPPSCAVGEPRRSYWGEQTWPLLIQNVHRYFMYIAVIFIFLLARDVWDALWWEGAAGKTEFHVSVGTLVLALNTVLLGGYTFGCHSLRHLIGGGKDHLPESARGGCYDCVSGLNRRHAVFAWMSLFMVMLADVYVRLCAMGKITDWRIF